MSIQKWLNGGLNRAVVMSLIGVSSLFLFTHLHAAPQPELIKDFNQISSFVVDGNQPLREVCSEIVELDGIAYFCGNGSQAEGPELWRSDGTSAGTYIVKDIIPGVNGSSPFGLTVLNNEVVFAASANLPGTNSTRDARAIWKSDGTPEGTVLVYGNVDDDFNLKSTVESENSVGRNRRVVFYEVNGELIFFAQENIVNGLWKTDGTAQGTTVVELGHTFLNSRPIVIANSLFFVSSFQSQLAVRKLDGLTNSISIIKPISINRNTLMTEHQGSLFFVGDDPQTGFELWVSDGTLQGTTLVKDFSPGQQDSQFVQLVSSGDFLFARLTFRDENGLNPTQSIWKTQGLPSNTAILTETFGNRMVDFNGLLVFECNLFAGGNRTCVRNATDTITVIDEGSPVNALEETIVIGNKLFISRDLGDLSVLDQATLTFSVIDINDTTVTNGRASPKMLANVGGVLFFAGNDGIHGETLWKSDGTENGTSLVKDINPTTNASVPALFVGNTIGESLIVNVDVGKVGALNNKEEIWITDGSELGTQKIADGRAGNDGFIQLNDTLIFSGTNVELDPNPGGGEPFITDGTSQGTTLLKDINSGTFGSGTSNLGEAGGLVYFSARASNAGREHLWKTDGSESGTSFVKMINEQGGDDRIRSLTDVGGVAFFTANDGLTGNELWKSDGTQSGTVQVKDINPGTASTFFADNFVELNGNLLFIADGPNLGQQLWISDGTELGTNILKQIGANSCTCGTLTKVGDKVFFKANEGGDDALWVTDGTTIGTVKIEADRPDGNGVIVNLRPSALTASVNHLYFSTSNGIWRSDGTNLGTQQIAQDIIFAGGNVGLGKGIGNTVYFSALATTGQGVEVGQELWRTDGTDSGTQLVANIAPEFEGSFPQGFTVGNDRLYFSAQGPEVGRELYTLKMLPYVQRVSYLQGESAPVINPEDVILNAFSTLRVQFDQALNDPLGDSGINDVSNPQNYRLLEAGSDKLFSTQSCNGVVSGDDVAIDIVAIEYSAEFFSSTVTIDDSNGFSIGSYRLFVCADNAVQNIYGTDLDGNDDGVSGDDFILNFRVDNPGVVNFVAESLMINEDGTSGFIEVERSGGSFGNVSVSYNVEAGTASQGDDFSAASGILSWNDLETGIKQIPFTVNNDSVDELDEVFSVSLSQPTANLSLGDTTSATVTIKDDDTAGFMVSIRGGVGAVSEDGGFQFVDVVLASEPLSSVTISAESNNTNEGDVSSGSLVFTPENWDEQQELTVTGVDDLLDDGDIQFMVAFASSAVGDGNYNNLEVQNLSFINTDNDEDSDMDGIIDQLDNCPLVENLDQINSDTDEQGDACDLDDDNDLVPDVDDAFPLDPTESADLDEDGIGDNADLDDDGDNTLDEIDNCVGLFNPDQIDTDADLQGDLCDNDDDNDGIDDVLDLDNLNPLVCIDVDNDSCDDCSIGVDQFGPLNDFDENNDGLDTNSNGQCDLTDPDDDSDGVLDEQDNCPLIENADQLDENGFDDGANEGDACEVQNDEFCFPVKAQNGAVILICI